MKRCPFCAEEIQDAAIVCRYCQADLVRHQRGQTVVQGRSPSPGVAAVLTLVIPGAGELYRGHVVAGLVIFAIVVTCYAVLIPAGLLAHAFAVWIAAKPSNPPPPSVPR